MLVREYAWKGSEIPRAGIIPLLYYNNEWFFAFSLGASKADIGDFGGHREKKDDSLLDAVVREYQEEALGVFGGVSTKQLSECLTLIGDRTVEIIYPISGNPLEYTIRFRNLVLNCPGHEVQNIVWLSLRQLPLLWKEKLDVYDRIRNTLRANYNLLRRVLENPYESAYLLFPHFSFYEVELGAAYSAVKNQKDYNDKQEAFLMILTIINQEPRNWKRLQKDLKNYAFLFRKGIPNNLYQIVDELSSEMAIEIRDDFIYG